MGLGFFLRCGIFDRVQIWIQPMEMVILRYISYLLRDVLPLHKTLYKKTWMNRVDVLLFVGVTLVMLPSPANKLYLMVGAGLVVFVLSATLVYILYTCKCKNTNEHNFMS